MKTQTIQGHKAQSSQLFKSTAYNKPKSRRNIAKEGVDSRLYQGIQGASQETNLRNATVQNFFTNSKHKRQNTQDRNTNWSYYKETSNQGNNRSITRG